MKGAGKGPPVKGAGKDAGKGPPVKGAGKGPPVIGAGKDAGKGKPGKDAGKGKPGKGEGTGPPGKGEGTGPPVKGAGKVPPTKGPTKEPAKGPVKGVAKGVAKGAVKALRWVIILLIPLNIMILLFSFALPGKLKWFDNYQVAVQKILVHQMDKRRSMNLFHRQHDDRYAANAIQYAELAPYLDDVQPGTLFFSEHGRRVSKIFIRKEWKHCGIYLGTLPRIEQYWGKDHDLVTWLRAFYTTGDEHLVFDSSYDQGVSVHSIREMAGLHDISTLRKLLLFEFNRNKETWSQVIQNSILHLGKAYDYCFVLDNDDALYCAEFLYEALPLEKNYFTPSAKIAGRPLLLPSDLVDAILDKGISSGVFTLKACISKKEDAMPVQSLQ